MRRDLDQYLLNVTENYTIVNTKKLVEKLFEVGESDRIVIQIESNSVDEEYQLSDTISVSVRVKPWSEYFTYGGPFRRRVNEDVLKWLERVDQEIETFEFPDISHVVNEALNYFKEKVKDYHKDKFTIFKILGPTESSEMFFAPSVPEELRHYDQSYHRYDFAVYMKLRKDKAYKLYDTIAKYVLEVVKAAAELDIVDAIRISDDIADYRGLLYPKSFIYDKYLIWHEEFSKVIRSKGKFPLLHCDGNIEVVIEDLAKIYVGLHPIDISKRTTIVDAYVWLNRVVELHRKLIERNYKTIFITGIPIELIFNDNVSVNDVVSFVENFVLKHGTKLLLLSTTHRPFPKRSYSEELPRRKALEIRKKLISQPP